MFPVLSQSCLKNGARCYSSSIHSSPLRIAIVGAGPAGFYTASRLLMKKKQLEITFFEKRIVPFGLVRYGVAPDHPEVKNCIHHFQEIGESSRVKYYGNLELGKDFLLEDLQTTFHAIVLCLGATSDKNVVIPGEESTSNVFRSSQVVGWYNGMPEHSQLALDLTRTDTAAIFGHGNVALDMARILLSPISVLRETDISKIALAQLQKSQIRHVYLIGRRSPLNVSFTSAEFREMLRLPDCEYVTDRVAINSVSAPTARPLKRLFQLMLSSPVPSMTPTKSWHLMFLRSPVRISPTSVQLSVNQLVDGNAQHTDHSQILKAGLFIKAFGYSTHPVVHDRGFVLENISHFGSCKIPLYVSGWLKTGPKGTIADTLRDAYETADTLLSHSADWKRVYDQKNMVPTFLLRKPRIDWQAWGKINEVEKKTHQKILTNEEMLEIASKQ